MTTREDTDQTRIAERLSNRLERQSSAHVGIAPRLFDREKSAVYLNTSVDTIDRLIQAGVLPVVRLPVERQRKSNRGVPGVGRRILLDVKDLDALVERSKETRA